MAPRSVPSKIVIAGNSKMSLNERFSSIPKPRPAQKKAKFVPNIVYEHAQYEQKTAFAPRPVLRRPQQNYQRRAVPLHSRVSFVKTIPTQRQFLPRNNFVQKPTQFQNFKKPFNRPVGNQRAPNGFNNNNRVFHNGGQANRGFRGRVFPTVPKKKSLAELDRELDDYMRKPKHTPITI